MKHSFIFYAALSGCVGSQQTPPASPQQDTLAIADMSCETLQTAAVEIPQQTALFQYADKYVSCGHDDLIFENLLVNKFGANLLTHLEKNEYPVMEKLGTYLKTHTGTKLFAKSVPTTAKTLPTEWSVLKKFAVTKPQEQRLCTDLAEAGASASNKLQTSLMWYLREANCQGQYAIAAPFFQSDLPNERYAACKTWGWLGGDAAHLDRMIELSETDPTQGLYSSEPKDKYSVRVICAGAISKILDRSTAATMTAGKTSLTYSSIDAMQSKLYLPAGAALLTGASSTSSVTYTAPSSDKRIPWSIRIAKIGAASLQDAERNVTQVMGKVESSIRLPGNRFQVNHKPRGIARSIDVFADSTSAHCEGPASEAAALSAICASFIQLP